MGEGGEGRRGEERGGEKVTFREKWWPEIRLHSQATVVYHLQKLPGKSGWKVDGTRLFWSFWLVENFENTGTSEKVVLFFRTECSKWKFVFSLFKAIFNTSLRRTYTKHRPQVYGPPLWPSPWTSSWTRSLDYPHGPPLIFEDEFWPWANSKKILENLNGRKLCQFILSGLKAPHITHWPALFLNSISGFGLVWKEKLYFKIFEGDMRRG